MSPRPVIAWFVSLPPREATLRGQHPVGFGLLHFVDPAPAWFDGLCARLGEALAPAGIAVEPLPLPDDPDYHLDLVTPTGWVRLFLVGEGPSRHPEAPPGWWSWWMSADHEGGEVDRDAVLARVVAVMQTWPDLAGVRLWEDPEAHRAWARSAAGTG